MAPASCSNYRAFIDHVRDAHSVIYCCTPGLTEERAHALVDAANRGVDVHVLIDPSEQTERHGYGALRAIDILRPAGVGIRELRGNAIAFLLADGEGYLFFPQSRIFAEEGSGYNTVHLTDDMSERLVHFFFSHAVAKPHPSKEVQATCEEVSYLDEDALRKAQESLCCNPPRDPDMTRAISVYTTKLQFVEVTLIGGNFVERSVSLPPDIPLGVSAALQERLKTRMRIFGGDNDSPGIRRFRAFCRSVEEFREEHSVYLPTRKKRIFKTENKQRLLAAFLELREQIPRLIDEMAAEVVRSIGSVQVDLEDEVAHLLTANPPPELGFFLRDPILLEEESRRLARRIVARIEFPHPSEILSKIAITHHFYDMTWEDFADDSFIHDLLDKGVVKSADATQLRSLRDAYEARQ